jgi:hypothetical protein
MYTCYVAQGKDRGGLQYRYMAYEMLGRLQVKLEASFHDPMMVNSITDTKYQRALSRSLWGIYCFERYGEPSPQCRLTPQLTYGASHVA